MRRIEIVEHRTDWPDRYRELAETIRAVGPPGSTLHHIGSTAVPGLGAKDVVDIQLSVDRLEEVDIGAFATRRFEHRPGLRDHLPPGMTLPEQELGKLYFRGPDRRSHLHVRERGRFNQRYALLCRDYLRTHPDAAQAYEAVKRQLARFFSKDDDGYYAVKDPVFDILMAGANEWAATVGWTEPPED